MPLSLASTSYPSDGPEASPPLLVAHGLFGSARNWNTLAQRLARGRRVVAVDMRNHGASPWDAAMDYPAMAGDLAATIRTECGGLADVLGHSMGGKAAMVLALAEPARVNRLVAADIAPVAYTHTHAHTVAAMQALDLGAVTRRGDADRMLAEAIPDRALRGFLLQSLALDGGRAAWRLNLAAIAAHMADLIGFPDTAARFDGPAVFLHGGASDYVTEAHHPAIRRLFPHARFETLAGAGHWLHAEQPDAFTAAVLAALA